MPRYYFHIKDEGEAIHDREGIELRGQDAVREKATESAREMMSEKIREGYGPGGRAFVVTDEHGHMVLTFPFRDGLRD